MKSVQSTNSPNFPREVQEACDTLSCTVEFFDINMTEPVYKCPPNICPHTVPNGHSNVVYWVAKTLWRATNTDKMIRQVHNILADSVLLLQP